MLKFVKNLLTFNTIAEASTLLGPKGPSSIQGEEFTPEPVEGSKDSSRVCEEI